MPVRIFAFLLLFFGFRANSQVFMDRSGVVAFYASTQLENIEAKNNQLYAVIDTDKKQLAFAVLLKGFLFKKQLMQTHFNENYVESDKYPKATFAGTYTGEINGNTANRVTIKGSFTLHGVTNLLELPVILYFKNNQLTGKALFRIRPQDYQIKIPALVQNKIASEVEVSVNIIADIKK